MVGESGCGKSTLARMVALIEKPTEGSLVLDGTDAVATPASERRRLRQAVQLVFQNPYGSLNPRKKISAVLEDPLAINTALGKTERAAKAREMLSRVGLRAEHANRYPHMFSGGQRQRIAIARALMLGPRLLVADEPVSALDVSIQAQVLNLLADLQQEFQLAYLFISHDLAVVRHIAHDVLVMYLGHVMEQGPKERIYARPLHPYTNALLASTPGVGAPQQEAHRAAGRVALAAEPAGRLRVFQSLSVRGGPLPGAAAAAAAAWSTNGWSPATSPRSSSESGFPRRSRFHMVMRPAPAARPGQTFFEGVELMQAIPNYRKALRACARPPGAAGVLAAAGAGAKTLVFCSEGSPENFYPGINTTGTSFDGNEPIYNRIVEFERGGTKVRAGPLAEKWTISPDGTGLHLLPAQGREVAQHQ